MTQKREAVCAECGQNIHPTDISNHSGKDTALLIQELALKKQLKQSGDYHECYSKNCNGYLVIENRTVDVFKCPVCQASNCIKCKKIHPQGTVIHIYCNYNFIAKNCV